MRVQHKEKASLYLQAIRWSLDFPIFYKILVANTALTVAGIASGFWLGSRYVFGPSTQAIHWGPALAIGAAGVLAFTSLNYLIIWAALQPVSRLSRLVAALRRGKTHVRAERPLFGDRESILLIHTANSLLDELATYRERAEQLSQRTTEQLENERRNIARELHDETAQNLVGLLVLLQMIPRAPSEAARAEAVEDARQLARITLEGVQRISVGLRPILLDDVGLPGTLRWYVRELMHDLLPHVALDLEEGVGRLPALIEINLYRIAQEALSNVARHAHASNVGLSLVRQNDHVILRVTDDGIGFDPDAPELRRPTHLGLFTMKERARLAGGVATIISQPARGTTVEARIPLPQGERSQI